MFEELLETMKTTNPLTQEQMEAFKSLPKDKKDELLKYRNEARKKAESEKHRRILTEIYEDTVIKYPNTKEKLRIAYEVLNDPKKFEKSFNTKTNQKLNEVLLCAYQSDKTDQQLKDFYLNKIVEKNIGLVWSTVAKYSSKNDGKMTLDDFGQEAMEKFISAVKKYDISRENKFSTFIVTVIKHSIFSGYVKVNKRRAIEMSTETPIADDGGSVKTLLDYQVDPSDTPHDLVMRESRNGIIYDVLNRLTLEQKFVAYCRYGLGGVPKKTQAEIAQYMHMSQANVSKIESAMLRILKRELYREGAL